MAQPSSNDNDREWTVADLLQEADDLAHRVGCASHQQLFARFDRGDYRGSILESKLSSIRFLLEEDEPRVAAE
jgi:hypothetical protein